MMEAPYITCHNLTASYDTDVLFKDLSFTVHPGERWGIIGPNGAGKSTLFKLIKGQLKPVQGTIAVRNNVRVSYIDQKIDFDENLTVEKILREALPAMYDSDLQFATLDHEINEHSLLAEKDPSLYENEKWADKLHDLNLKIAEVPTTPTSNIIQSALKVGKLVEIAGVLFKSLSGGQQKRVQIVAALLKNPNLILLDEPTNHLDIQTVEWLEEFLLQVAEQGFSLFGMQANDKERESVAYIIISHDRALLDTLVNKILEIEQGESKKYEGNYEKYSELKLESMLVFEKTNAKLANTMRRELEWLRRGARARTTKQTARIERAEALDKKLNIREKKANTNTKAELTFSAQMTDQHRDKDDHILTRQHNLTAQELVKLIEVSIKHPSKNKPDHYLFQNLNFLIKPKNRIAILGPNGSGKSTLLKYIAEKLKPFKGEIKYHDLSQLSYFDQKRATLDGTQTVRKTVAPEGDNVYFSGKYIHINTYLERFLFSKADGNKIVAELSGGEQARLLLAKLMLEQGNVLILDEPTNDLDIVTLQILEKNLVDFNGGVLFTSHDRYFMQKIATTFLTYMGEKGNTSQWSSFPDLGQAIENVEKFQEESRGDVKDDPIVAQPSSVENVSKSRKLSFKEQKEFESLEVSIPELEKKLESVNKALEKAYTSQKDFAEIKLLNSELADLQSTLKSAYFRWEKLV